VGAGANIGAVDDRGANALLTLVKSSTAVFNVELAELLLTKGCSAVQKPTKGTWTAVGWIEKMLVRGCRHGTCKAFSSDCCLNVVRSAIESAM
jgi:hypothetical protein